MAENGKNLRLGLVIEAIDKASSIIERVNERVERMAAPVNRVSASLHRLYETSRLGELRERFDKVGESVEKIQRQAQSMLSLETYVGLAGGALFELTHRVAEGAEQVKSLSSRLGISTRDVQRLGYAAKQSGGDIDSFAEMMGFLNRNVVEAQRGNKDLLQLFHAIGISTQDLRKDSPVELLYKISDWFEKFPNKAREGYVAMTLMGRGAGGSVPMLQKGSKEIKALGDEAERVGGIMGKEGFENAEKYNASLTRMQRAVGGLTNRLGAELLPNMTKLFDRITAFSATRPKFFEDLTTRLGDIIEQLPEILGSFGQLFIVLSALLGVGTKIANVFGGWGNVIGALAFVQIAKLIVSIYQLGEALTAIAIASAFNPLLLTLGAIAAAIILVVTNWDKLSKLSASLSTPPDLAGAAGARSDLRFNRYGLPVADGAKSSVGSFSDLVNGIDRRLPAGALVPPLSMRDSAPSLAPAAANLHSGSSHRVNVGGELKISIDASGRARVQNMKTRGPMDIHVASGPISVGTP